MLGGSVQYQILYLQLTDWEECVIFCVTHLERNTVMHVHLPDNVDIVFRLSNALVALDSQHLLLHT